MKAWILVVAAVCGSAAVWATAGGAQTEASPELGKIAFWREQRNRCAMFTVNADGTGLRPLTSWGFRDCVSPPVWSPDGRRIAFYANGALWVMSPDGSQRRALGPASYSESGGPSPSWSSDGQSLAFTRNPDAHRNASAVFTIQIDGKRVRRLTPERFAEKPSWSPDGTRIAFTSDVTNEGELFVMRPDGTRRKRLTRNKEIEESVAWSPDGGKLAYLEEALYSINPDGSARRLLTNAADYLSSFSWSPDGRRIAFGTEYDIAVMSAKGFGERSLTKRGYNHDPSWSPDGRSVVCGYFERLEGPSMDGLRLLSVDGKSVRLLTHGTDSSPAWQPRPR